MFKFNNSLMKNLHELFIFSLFFLFLSNIFDTSLSYHYQYDLPQRVFDKSEVTVSDMKGYKTYVGTVPFILNVRSR